MKENFIQNAPLFAELSDDEQRAIGKRMRLENYKPDEVLFVKEGESEAVYLIKEGWVKLSTDDTSSVMANLGPGSLVGETDFFLGRLHTMTARASGQVTVWSLDNQALADIIAKRPEIGVSLGLAIGTGIAQYQPYLTEQLTQNPLLQSLTDRERSLIAKRLSPHRYVANEAIYRSGDSPTGLYFIVEGTVRVLGETDEEYTELGYGEAFGEMAVISGKPHSNTAQAASELILWQLSPTDFDSLAKTNPTIKTNLSRNLRASLTATDRTHAINILKRISLFADLPADALNDIARLLLLRHVPGGEIIFSQGDSGDAMYVVDTGSVDAVSDTLEKPSELVARFVEGDFFGEIALLTGKTRPFAAYAATDTNLWALYRTDFDNLLVKFPQLSVGLSRTLRERLGSSGEYTAEPHLKKIALLGGLSRMQIDELSARLEPRRYQGGSTVYFEGRTGDEMYFIESGQVEHWANTMRGPMLLETLAEGDFFGEIALLSGRNHPTTAYAVRDTHIWALSKAEFDDFLKRYPNLGVTFSRILSQRLEETMSRLRGGAPQRGLPPATGPAMNPPGPASRPFAPQGPRPGPPPGVQPSRPAQLGSGPRPPQAMPPVPVRPVAPGGSRPMPPVRALSAQTNPPARPPQGPPIHSQHTMGMTPVRRGPPSEPSVHSQHTQAISPVQRAGPPGPARPGSGPVRVERPGPGSKESRSKPKRKKKKSRVIPPGRGGSPAEQSVHSQFTQPIAPVRAGSRPVAPIPQQGKARAESRPSTPVGRSAPKSGPPPAQARGDEPVRRRSGPFQSRVVSNRRIQRYNSGISVWYAKLSMGAKLRLLAIMLIIIWLCGIMAPSWIIQVLAATFEDNGAVAGDDRSVVNQVREDGAVGAVAVLPFVETATSTPTMTPTPTTTPSQTPIPTETPIPTSTHTPTLTPTPTETPTPIFTPTPTDTATPSFTSTPRPPTDTPEPTLTPTPDVDFRVKSQRQLTPCENHGKHHIFIKVTDPSGQGINGVPVKIQWAAGADGFIVTKTETKTNLLGSLEPGHIDFAMFKGTYAVEVQGGTSEVANGITPDFGVNEPCGDDATANSLFHISFEVIFERTF
ncbi:MAG TPA: cyclic nucleotide-binding domain-containing protein [Anaerolineae bacterium]